MAGVKGRSGRKPKALVDHVTRGTYRADRHGPLPDGGRAAVLQMPAPAAAPLPAPIADDVTADASGVAFVARMLAEFSDWSIAERTLLRLAGEAYDRVIEVRQAIAKDGVSRRSRRGGVTAHPLLAAERRAVASFAALLKQLDLKG